MTPRHFIGRIRKCRDIGGLTELDVQQVENLLECQSALKDLLAVITTNQLISESYMKRAREALTWSPKSALVKGS